MNTGMLWYDSNPKTDLSSKIKRAATYYHQKYGKKPDLCFVHPSIVKKSSKTENGIMIQPNNLVLPHHFWIGIQEPISQTIQDEL